MSSIGDDGTLQGYLLKQGVRGVIRTWKRRFFVLKEKKLLYYEGANMKGFIDLELATSIHAVRSTRRKGEAEEGMCDLQVVTPIRVYNLRASSVEEMNSWISSLKAARLGTFGVVSKSKEEEESIVCLKSRIVGLEEEREALFGHLNTMQAKLQRLKSKRAENRWIIAQFPTRGKRTQSKEEAKDLRSSSPISSEDELRLSGGLGGGDVSPTSPSSPSPESEPSAARGIAVAPSIRKLRKAGGAGQRVRRSHSSYTSLPSESLVSAGSPEQPPPPVLDELMKEQLKHWYDQMDDCVQHLKKSRRSERSAFTQPFCIAAPTSTVAMPMPTSPAPPPPHASPSFETRRGLIGSSSESHIHSVSSDKERIAQLELLLEEKEARIAMLEQDVLAEHAHVIRHLACVTEEFTARTVNELSVSVGDRVLLEKNHSDSQEWVLAKRGELTGLIPRHAAVLVFPASDYTVKPDPDPRPLFHPQPQQRHVPSVMSERARSSSTSHIGRRGPCPLCGTHPGQQPKGRPSSSPPTSSPPDRVSILGGSAPESSNAPASGKDSPKSTSSSAATSPIVSATSPALPGRPLLAPSDPVPVQPQASPSRMSEPDPSTPPTDSISILSGRKERHADGRDIRSDSERSLESDSSDSSHTDRTGLIPAMPETWEELAQVRQDLELLSGTVSANDIRRTFVNSEETVRALIASLAHKDVLLDQMSKRAELYCNAVQELTTDVHTLEAKYLSLLSLRSSLESSKQRDTLSVVLATVQLWSSASGHPEPAPALPSCAALSNVGTPICILCRLPFSLLRQSRSCFKCGLLLCGACYLREESPLRDDSCCHMSYVMSALAEEEAEVFQ